MDLPTNPQRRQSPLMMRRYLARRIVELREAAGLGQAKAAKLIGVSTPKLQYLEYGKRPLQEDDLEALLRAYEVPKADHDELRSWARAARAKGRYDHYDDNDVSPSAKRHADYEWGARRLRVFSGTLVPALLQTPAYTRALLATTLVRQSPEQIARQVEVRRRRQEALMHPDAVEYHAVVDEGALHKAVGGSPLGEQLEHIAAVAENRPNVAFQVVPHSAGLYPAQAGTFTLMDFGLDDPGVLQVEPALAAAMLDEDREDVHLHSRAFDELTRVALDADETIDLLRTVARG